MLIGLSIGITLGLAGCFYVYHRTQKELRVTDAINASRIVALAQANAKEANQLCRAVINRWLRASESVTLDESLDPSPAAPGDEEKALDNMSLPELEKELERETGAGTGRTGLSRGPGARRQALARAVARKRQMAERSIDPAERPLARNPDAPGDDLPPGGLDNDDISHLNSLA